MYFDGGRQKTLEKLKEFSKEIKERHTRKTTPK